MGLIDLSKLSGQLKEIAEFAAAKIKDKKEIDDYREVSIFKATAESLIQKGTADFTQDDVNEIFGLAKSPHQEHTDETDGNNRFISDSWGHIHDEEADEAYKAGNLDRAAVTKEVEVLLGEACGKAIADMQKAVDDVYGITDLKHDLLGYTPSFMDKEAEYTEFTDKADKFHSLSRAVYRTLYKNEGVMDESGPQVYSKVQDIAKSILGCPAKEFYEKNKDDIDFLHSVKIKFSMGKVTMEELLRASDLKGLTDKINKYHEAMETFKEFEETKNKNAVQSLADDQNRFADDIQKLKDNEDASPDELQELTPYAKKYYNEAVHNVYRSNQEATGVENIPVTTNNPVRSYKVAGEDGKSVIIVKEFEKPDGTKYEKRYNMAGQEIQ